MAWLQLKCLVGRDQSDELSSLLDDLGATSLTFEDAEDDPILEPLPGETPLWESLKVAALFDAEAPTDDILAKIRSHSIGKHLTGLKFELLEDKDWIRAWMDEFSPMRFGSRLWIVPSWLEPPQPDAVNIMLDPGLAFGSGTHPTTALCLEWLDKADLKDKAVLDFGCGSGILAIAAHLLGAKEVCAEDIDRQAIVATNDNMKRNGINTDAIKVGYPNDFVSQKFDIIIANILVGPLLSLVEAFSERLKPGGTILLSGLLAEQEKEIRQVYKKCFNISQAVQQEDWIRLEGTKLKSSR